MMPEYVLIKKKMMIYQEKQAISAFIIFYDSNKLYVFSKGI
jgi:hypothetical protein